MATRFSPPAFSPKASDEVTTITLDFTPDIGVGKTITEAKWRSLPVGLGFSDDTGIDGGEVSIQISGGNEGVEYRIVCEVSVAGSNDTYISYSGDFVGVPILILPESFAASPQSDYAYGNI